MYHQLQTIPGSSMNHMHKLAAGTDSLMTVIHGSGPTVWPETEDGQVVLVPCLKFQVWGVCVSRLPNPVSLFSFLVRGRP